MAKQDLHFSITATNEDLKRKLAESRQAIIESGKTAEAMSQRAIGSFGRMAGSLAAVGGGFTLALAARELYSFANAFDKSMKEVSTISATVTNDLDGFKQGILEMTTQIPIGADEAAKALYQIVSAGHDGAAGRQVLEVAAKAAIGGVTQTVTAADAITTVLNAYKKDAGEAEGISDQLFTTVRLGKTTFGELGQSISQAVPIAASFGIETEQVLAAVATLTKSGVPTAQAMTQIRASITAASKALGDGYFQTHTFQEGLVEIANRAGGSESKLRELVPEIEAINGILGLTGINAKMAASDLAELGNSAGATGQAFGKMNDQADAQLTILKNNTLKKFYEIGDGAVNVLGGIAKVLNSEGLFGDTVFDDLTSAITALIVIYATYKGVVLATGVAQKINMAILRQAVLEKQLAVKWGKTLSTTEAVAAARTKAFALAQQGLAKALKAAGAAALANPYMLIAVAVTAVVYGIYKLVTAQTAAEKAAESYNKQLETQKENIEQMRSDSDKLIGVIKSEAATILQKNEANKKLHQLYPELLKNYSMENLILMDNLELQRLINAELDKKTITDQEKEYATTLATIKKLKDAYQNSLKTSRPMNYDAYSGALTPLIEKARLQSEGLYEARVAFEEAIFDAQPREVRVATLTRNISELEGDIARIKKLLEDPSISFGEKYLLGNNLQSLEDQKGAKSTQLAGFTLPSATASNNYEKDYLAAKKAWRLAESTQQKISSNRSKYTKEEYDAAAASAKNAKETFEKLGGETKSSTKEIKDYSSAVKGAMLELERMKIDLLKDGRVKELAQIEQGRVEKIAAIEKEQQEIAAILKKGGLSKDQKDDLTKRSEVLEEQKGVVVQRGDMDAAMVEKKYTDEQKTRWAALTSVFQSEQQKQAASIEDKYEKEREWADKFYKDIPLLNRIFKMNIDAAEAKEQLEALTADYQIYGDERKKIEEKFNSDIKALEAKNTDGKLNGNIAAAKKQRDEALNGLKFDEAKEGVDLSKLFGNLDNMTLPSMKELRDKIKIWIDGAGKDLSPEDLKAVSDAFNNLDLKIADKDPFAVMKTSAEDYKKALKEVKKTQKEYDKTKAESKLASDGLAAAEKKLAEAEKEWQAVLANPAKSDIEGVAASVVAAEDEVEAAKQKATAATKKQTDAEKELTTAQNERAAAVAKSTESLQSAANKGQQIVGMAKDILGILDDLGVEVPEQISGAIDGLGQMFDGLASINLNEPLSVVTGAVKALGGAIKVVSSLFNGDSKRERNIAEWQKSIDDLEMQYETLEKAIDKAYSSDASQLMDQSNELLERQKALIQQQKEAEKSKKDPDDGALDSYDDKIDEINEKIEENKEKAIDVIFGADLQSAIDSFASAYVDAWDAGEDRAAAQKDVVKKMIQGIVAEIIKGNIAGKVAELRAALKEAVSDDGVIDEIEQAEIDKLQEEIYAQSAKDAKAYEKSLKGDDTSNDKSMAGQIRGSVATEASVSELGGLFRSQTDSLLRIDAKMDLGFGHLMEIARSNAAIEANTAMTAANTAQTVIALAGGFSSMQIELQAINKNTSKDNGSYGN